MVTLLLGLLVVALFMGSRVALTLPQGRVIRLKPPTSRQVLYAEL